MYPPTTFPWRVMDAYTLCLTSVVLVACDFTWFHFNCAMQAAYTRRHAQQHLDRVVGTRSHAGRALVQPSTVSPGPRICAYIHPNTRPRYVDSDRTFPCCRTRHCSHPSSDEHLPSSPLARHEDGLSTTRMQHSGPQLIGQSHIG
ncbi:hypothetical protein L226DRAFT_155631 [Lentinus tigrinus ALCF2SS1-7]|uniref:uncharacterized protein n=1 Tax=Lentinus tigrinus ALCF2SS1-7 TaxID=1328758 RepID=UPI001165FFE0|nr:hypothetical protein L226DRAFT_155631 [Lentinus tigrinus ALCF2SS1-7]